MVETLRGTRGSELGIGTLVPVVVVIPAIDLSGASADKAAFAPGFPGKILRACLHMTTASVGADDDLAGVAVDIGATECTDALMQVNDENGVADAVIMCADPDIDALNEFLATDFITIRLEQATDPITTGVGTVTLILGVLPEDVPSQYPLTGQETLRAMQGEGLSTEAYIPVLVVFPGLDLTSADADLIAFAPGFDGKILSAYLHVTTASEGADDDLAYLEVDIGATECTDAKMGVNDANGALDAVIACADPSIDALNAFAKEDFITIRMDQATDPITTGNGTVTLILGMKADKIPSRDEATGYEQSRGSIGGVLDLTNGLLPMIVVLPTLDLTSVSADLKAFAPGFVGKILQATLHITTAVEGADADLAGIAVDIDAVECADALTEVNDANGIADAVIECADTTIDALNEFDADNFITVRIEQAADPITTGVGTLAVVLGALASDVPAQYPTNA